MGSIARSAGPKLHGGEAKPPREVGVEATRHHECPRQFVLPTRRPQRRTLFGCCASAPKQEPPLTQWPLRGFAHVMVFKISMEPHTSHDERLAFQSIELHMRCITFGYDSHVHGYSYL